MTDEQESWHLDKRVPIALILFLIIQTITIVILGTAWKDGVDGRLSVIETNQQGALPRVQANTDLNHAQERRLAILETKLEGLGNAIGRVENGITTLTNLTRTGHTP